MTFNKSGAGHDLFIKIIIITFSLVTKKYSREIARLLFMFLQDFFASARP